MFGPTKMSLSKLTFPMFCFALYFSLEARLMEDTEDARGLIVFGPYGTSQDLDETARR